MRSGERVVISPTAVRTIDASPSNASGVKRTVVAPRLRWTIEQLQASIVTLGPVARRVRWQGRVVLMVFS